MKKTPKTDYDLARWDAEAQVWVDLTRNYWRGFVGFCLLTLAALIGIAWTVGGC